MTIRFDRACSHCDEPIRLDQAVYDYDATDAEHALCGWLFDGSIGGPQRFEPRTEPVEPFYDLVDMDAVVMALKARGIAAYVEQTGGGCATIYAGPKVVRDGEERWAAAAGPGWFEGPGWSNGRGVVDDFYVGPDDGGETRPVTVTTTDPAKIAELIVDVVWASA